MIRVTVELLPFGFERNKRTLGVLEIANDGTGTNDKGHYNAKLKEEFCGERTGRVTNFNRHQSVWSLVGAFLKLFGHTTHYAKELHKLRRKKDGDS